jgi:enamine deaminase RidA (YjgF/YER057c/UK114 family)
VTTKVERFYIGPQIATSTTKSEKTSGGVPVAAAARAGNMVWTNGVVSADPETGAMVAGDIRVQTKRVLENLKMVLEKAGSSFDRVVMVHSFLRDMNDWPAYHEVYVQYFDHKAPPPRYTVRAELADPRWLIEIHMTAVV